MTPPNPTLAALGRRLRLGLVGGGSGFIGPVPRTAARLDDRFEIVAGVFSSDAGRSRAFGRAIGLAPERTYADLPAMFEQIQTRRLHGALHPAAEGAARVEIGHPEGYQEAFGTLYREAADAIVAQRGGLDWRAAVPDMPTVLDGARGVRFIEAAAESARSGAWVDCRVSH